MAKSLVEAVGGLAGSEQHRCRDDQPALGVAAEVRIHVAHALQERVIADRVLLLFAARRRRASPTDTRQSSSEIAPDAPDQSFERSGVPESGWADAGRRPRRCPARHVRRHRRRMAASSTPGRAVAPLPATAPAFLRQPPETSRSRRPTDAGVQPALVGTHRGHGRSGLTEAIQLAARHDDARGAAAVRGDVEIDARRRVRPPADA